MHSFPNRLPMDSYTLKMKTKLESPVFSMLSLGDVGNEDKRCRFLCFAQS
jgi:hypothetical protein